MQLDLGLHHSVGLAIPVIKDILGTSLPIARTISASF